jgi:hypothetical protein
MELGSQLVLRNVLGSLPKDGIECARRHFAMDRNSQSLLLSGRTAPAELGVASSLRDHTKPEMLEDPEDLLP